MNHTASCGQEKASCEVRSEGATREQGKFASPVHTFSNMNSQCKGAGIKGRQGVLNSVTTMCRIMLSLGVPLTATGFSVAQSDAAVIRQCAMTQLQTQGVVRHKKPMSHTHGCILKRQDEFCDYEIATSCPVQHWTNLGAYNG